MAGGIEVILAANLFFELGYFRGEELDGDATVSAYHMMMAAPVKLVFIARHTIMKSYFTGQTAFGQQFQGTVDRGEPNLGVLFPGEPEKFISREMIAGLKKGAQDSIALLGMLQTDLLQMAVEYLLRLAHVLARADRLIVNALLQHSGNRARGDEHSPQGSRHQHNIP